MKHTGERPTCLAARLVQKDLLASRLTWLGIRTEGLERLVVNFVRGHGTLPRLGSRELEALRAWRLIRDERPGEVLQLMTPVLPFVSAVNLELTYSCNYSCSHCLQNGLRSTRGVGWLATGTAVQLVRDAWFAGLLTTYLNLTGGEIITGESNLVPVLEEARKLDVPVRVNTNGWWGRARQIRLGDKQFDGAQELIRWLASMGVQIIALSVDSRYVRDDIPWAPVSRIIEICEREGLRYEIVATGGILEQELGETGSRLGHDRHIAPFAAVLPVDIGLSDESGAFAHQNGLTLQPRVLGRRLGPFCGWRGFYAPLVVHVGPDGGVRSCMYASGSGALGNVVKERLLDIVNRFPGHSVPRLFRRGDLSAFLDRFVDRYVSHYRNIIHPCAHAAVVSRVAEEVHRAHRTGQTLTDAVMHEIHDRIAREYRLVPYLPAH